MAATVFYASSSELATIANTFSVSGTATDPTTVSLTITTPTGTATTYTYAAATITRTSAGVYTKDITCSEAGIWTYLWVGTGAASDAQAGHWTVLDAAPRLYATAYELKSRLGITDTVDDFEITLAVGTASRWVDEHCGRTFGRATATRTFEACGWYDLECDDLVSITTLKTDASGDGTFETTWTASDYQLLPVNPASYAETRPYTAVRAVGAYTFPLAYSYGQRRDLVQIVGTFGWAAVPEAVKQAALILASETLKIKDSPFGIAGFGDLGAVRVRDNPKIAALLAPYRRYPVLVA